MIGSAFSSYDTDEHPVFCFRGRCEPPQEQTTNTATSADLGQREAENEALSEEQF